MKMYLLSFAGVVGLGKVLRCPSNEPWVELAKLQNDKNRLILVNVPGCS